MKKRAIFFISYFLFWLLFLVFCKILFLAFFYNETIKLGFVTLLGVFGYGAALDFSILGYILLLPLVFLMLTSFSRGIVLYYFLKVYTWIIIIGASVTVVIDLQLYRFWGFRLDRSCLVYLSTPGDVVASVKWYTIVISLLVIIVIAAVFIFIAERYVLNGLRKMPKAGWPSLTSVFILPLLFILIRGGFDTSPINLSSAYFSRNMFANHSAVNLFWNIGYSFTVKETGKNPYTFYSPETLTKYMSELYKPQSKSSRVLKNSRPNIFIIVIESFSAKLIEPLSGEPGITPRFNQLANEGVFFTRLYATGNRSDRGMAAIISGYPSAGNIAVMANPHKFKKLPSLIKLLGDTGYSSELYYGGDISFFNFSSYFLTMGYDRLISKSDFQSKEIVSKWGVPDHILFDRFLKDLENTADTPFIKTLFTLSNHEPFDIPVPPKFKGSGQYARLYSGAHYTDSCIGYFSDYLKKSQWWDNSLVIFVADHGILYPGNYPFNARQNYHIPMLWTGGVIIKDTVIDAYGSQNDIPFTLLNQLGINTGDFQFSRDILSDRMNSFAIYNFKDGMGYLSDSVSYIYEMNSDIVQFYDSTYPDSMLVKYGKAFMQKAYDFFLSP